MIIAATGHRPEKLGGYTDPGASFALIRLADDYLVEQREAHPDLSVISGMALGWDLAVAQACYDLSIPFVAAVPFPGQADLWPTVARNQYRSLLAQAAKVRYVSYGRYTNAKMTRRNRWMVDNCNKIVALYDGTRGGTANCLGYAEQIGRPWENLWGRWLEIRPK